MDTEGFGDDFADLASAAAVFTTDGDNEGIAHHDDLLHFGACFIITQIGGFASIKLTQTPWRQRTEKAPGSV